MLHKLELSSLHAEYLRGEMGRVLISRYHTLPLSFLPGSAGVNEKGADIRPSSSTIIILTSIIDDTCPGNQEQQKP